MLNLMGVRSKNSALPGDARCALASSPWQGASNRYWFSTWCEALSFVQALRQSRGSETKIYDKRTFVKFWFWKSCYQSAGVVENFIIFNDDFCGIVIFSCCWRFTLRPMCDLCDFRTENFENFGKLNNFKNPLRFFNLNWIPHWFFKKIDSQAQLLHCWVGPNMQNFGELCSIWGG